SPLLATTGSRYLTTPSSAGLVVLRGGKPRSIPETVAWVACSRRRGPGLCATIRAMLWQTLVLVALCGADPSGRIAFLSGTTPENQTVCVLDLATRTVVPVGPGRHDGRPVWSPRGDA